MTRRIRTLAILSMLMMLFALPAFAEKDREQAAIDRAWLYLTEEAGISGELLQEAVWEQVDITLFGPERLVEMVTFTSALSGNTYIVYLSVGDNLVLMADELRDYGGLCVIEHLFLAPGLTLAK